MLSRSPFLPWWHTLCLDKAVFSRGLREDGGGLGTIRTHGQRQAATLDLVYASQNRDVGTFEQLVQEYDRKLPQSSTEPSVTGEIQKARFNERSGSDEGAAMPCSARRFANGRTTVSAMAEISTCPEIQGRIGFSASSPSDCATRYLRHIRRACRSPRGSF